jgi:competence protein ComEC
MTGLVADTLQGWVDQERGRFALWLPVAMSAGAVWYFELRMEPPVWLGAGLAGFAAALLLLLRRFFLLRALCSLVLATALGFTAAGVATANAPETIEVPRRAVMVSGVVREVKRLPPEKNDGRRIVLEQVHFADGPALPRTARIRLRANDETPLDVGDHIRLRALLSRPAPPAYPGGWDLQR